MDWNKLAKAVASHGRNGDSTLAHVNEKELQLLKARGGSGSINPITGLYEFYDAAGMGGSPADASASAGGSGMEIGQTGAGLPDPFADSSGSYSLYNDPTKANAKTGLAGLWDSLSSNYNNMGQTTTANPGAKAAQTAGSLMTPGFGMLSAGLKGAAALSQTFGGTGISDQQAAAQGAVYQGNPGGDFTPAQPIPDTSTIGTTAPVVTTGQNLSGLAPSHGLPPSVLDYLTRIGVLAL